MSFCVARTERGFSRAPEILRKPASSPPMSPASCAMTASVRFIASRNFIFISPLGTDCDQQNVAGRRDARGNLRARCVPPGCGVGSPQGIPEKLSARILREALGDRVVVHLV